MANKKFTPEEIAILKANPYVMEVMEDIIHFSALFKSSFWDRLQNGMKAPDIFRELGIDPNILGPNRVMGFKGMLKHEVLAGKGFRDLNTCKEYYAKCKCQALFYILVFGGFLDLFSVLNREANASTCKNKARYEHEK